MARWLVACLLCLAFVASAKEAPLAAADPALEARMLAVAAELRCLVCQNQTIADSHSGLADDLRVQIREQLARGASNEQVVAYMTDRYGDFVRYRPAFKSTTALLWVAPGVLLAGGLLILAGVLRRRARLAPDAFEPDDESDPDAPAQAATVAKPADARGASA